MKQFEPFNRDLFDPGRRTSRIGGGEVGGKAQGLLSVAEFLADQFPVASFPDFEINIPAFTVIGTDVFDAFLQRNNLQDLARNDAPDDVIALEFLHAQLPAEILGDLRALTEKVRVPLAVRSSSLLEDALYQPFAGVYLTKMIPNNQPDPNLRFRPLMEAVKLVYASVFFRSARDYIRACGRNPKEEKMAILVQEVVGQRFGDRFYPVISGVARSYNYYATGRARPEHGVASLALGLGKTIVDGGYCWTYSPAFPGLAPPVGMKELLQQTQTQYWAVNMGKPPAFDPTHETEYLLRLDLNVAEEDGVLRSIASTYDPQSDRLTPGTGKKGPRVLDFAGILRHRQIALNEVIRSVLEHSARAFDHPVEIEFAVALEPLRFGFLQVRPMVVPADEITIQEEDLFGGHTLVGSENVLGNGSNETIRDIVYVRRESFEPSRTPAVAAELEVMNRDLVARGLRYALIGFGRWGSSDPWLGIPVNWGQISGARVIVESTLSAMNVDVSQGSHFFHNLISFQVSYFCVRHEGDPPIRWDLLDSLPAEQESQFVRHVRVPSPLIVRVDGRTRRGVIMLR